jgi:hypothetical protein
MHKKKEANNNGEISRTEMQITSLLVYLNPGE